MGYNLFQAAGEAIWIEQNEIQLVLRNLSYLNGVIQDLEDAFAS